jgi:hypothetical protein
MDDTKKEAASANTASPPEAVPAAARDASDKAVFFRLLPGLAGSFTTQYNDAKTIKDLAVQLAREETGRLAGFGICRLETVCADGQALGLPSQPSPHVAVARPQPAPPSAQLEDGSPPLANTNGRGLQGQMVAHFPTNNVTKIQGL